MVFFVQNEHTIPLNVVDPHHAIWNLYAWRNCDICDCCFRIFICKTIQMPLITLCEDFWPARTWCCLNSVVYVLGLADLEGSRFWNWKMFCNVAKWFTSRSGLDNIHFSFKTSFWSFFVLIPRHFAVWWVHCRGSQNSNYLEARQDPSFCHFFHVSVLGTRVDGDECGNPGFIRCAIH